MSKKQQRSNKEPKKPKQDKTAKNVVTDPFAKGMDAKAGSKKK